MTLKKLSYSEFEGEPRAWELESLDFGQANLMVGRNATGKSRVVSVTTSLMATLAGTRIGGNSLESGHFLAEFLIAGVEYIYELAVSKRVVEKECLTVNGIVRLERFSDGKGRIYYSKEDCFLQFEVEPGAIAIQARRDRLQHPYIIELSEWAAASATYNFGTDFGKNTLMVASSEAPTTTDPTINRAADDPNNALITYIEAYRRFGDEFDKAIVEDMRGMGFPVNEVHAEPLDPSVATAPHGTPLMVMTVAEAGLPGRIPQIFLSQGMFRALALTIKLNWTVFSGRKGLILIDDLGEGLDYERACAAVELTMHKAKLGGCQVVVTSNDRFVMNSVPLENWIVLRREGARVKGYTPRNSPAEFENFRFTGLSNFDFFTSDVFH